MLSRTAQLLRPSVRAQTLHLSRPASTGATSKSAKPALVYKGRIPHASESAPSTTTASTQSTPQPKDTLSEAYKLPKVPGAEETGLGARIGGERDQRKKYKYAESRIVRAMCAAPIVIVLSVVLYQRREYFSVFLTRWDGWSIRHGRKADVNLGRTALTITQSFWAKSRRNFLRLLSPMLKTEERCVKGTNVLRQSSGATAASLTSTGKKATEEAQKRHCFLLESYSIEVL